VYGSIKIGSVLGITLRLHVLLLVLFGVLIVKDESPLVFAVLFGCVLLHELGHSLVALAFGVRVVDITLWPLGGIARMTQIPESSRIEALIALAGPTVNFLLAGLAYLVGMPGNGAFVLWNLGMGLLNLLPAFPLDGGRVLRAFLGRKGDWLAATEHAVWIGRWFALALFLLGFTGLLALPLVGLFIWWSGNQELASVRARHAPAPVPRAERSGFSAEEIAALERFRGRLADSHPDER